MEELKSYLPETLSNIVNEYSKELLGYASLTTKINVDNDESKATIFSIKKITPLLFDILQRFINHEFDQIFKLDLANRNISNIELKAITDPIEIDNLRKVKKFIPNKPDLFKLIESRITDVFIDPPWIDKKYEDFISFPDGTGDFKMKRDKLLNLFYLYVFLYDTIPFAKEEINNLYEEKLIDDYQYKFLTWLVSIPSFDEYYILARLQWTKLMSRKEYPNTEYIRKFDAILRSIMKYVDPKYLDIVKYNIEDELYYEWDEDYKGKIYPILD